MMGILALAVVMLAQTVAFGATLQEAMVRLASPTTKVVRANVVGRYATVLSRGGIMEGSPLNDAILLERFSFGWQPLEYLNAQCQLDAHVIGLQDRRSLMRGMPKLPIRPDCSGLERDAGPQFAIEAVRMQMQGPLTPAVAVVGSYALGEWYGAGGGQTLFRYSVHRWRQIRGGGGALDVSQMRAAGVSAATSCAFKIYHARCPP